MDFETLVLDFEADFALDFFAESAFFVLDFVADFVALFALDSALFDADFALDFDADFVTDFVALFALDSAVFTLFFAESTLDSALFAISLGSKYKIRPQCGQVTITSLLINSK